MKRWLIIILLAAAAWQLGESGYIELKARLAQYLLERAWQNRLAGELNVKPWPWADTSPVGKLALERTGETFIVLKGTSGRNLAFGPTWDPASYAVGEAGVALIAAHRDTHFQGLQHLRLNDRVRFQTPAGDWHWFRIRHLEVIDASRQAVSRDVQAGAGPQLVLVTCFPFDDWVPGGPLRYLVFAEQESHGVQATISSIEETNLSPLVNTAAEHPQSLPEVLPALYSVPTATVPPQQDLVL